MERNKKQENGLLVYDDFCTAVMCSSLIGLLDVLLDNHWSGSEDVMMLQRKSLMLLSKKVANIFFQALQLLFF